MVPDERADRPASAAGSTNPFDFDDQPAPGDGVDRRHSAPPSGDRFDPFGLDTRTEPTRTRTGQRVSWAAVILVLVGALAIGVGIAGALASIEIEGRSPLGAMLWWGTCALLGFLIIVIGLVSAIVGVVQAEPRVVAVIALIGAVVAGWIAAYIGFKIGAHELRLEALREVGTSGPDAIPAIATSLRERGVDVGPLLPILRQVFGR
ncbi:hypothetical protein [Microlunatus soli]|uniref:Uncharacterized protein n=1 Tax=Microlunatus soli TaxID=630515 RepID=A0A1H1UUK3_9ACTN|nr:hypothetical protein [Microlunatus soli]SDS76165.1 hypothetical protein SAMN04489812_2939 [Microlunatus soli]